VNFKLWPLGLIFLFTLSCAQFLGFRDKVVIPAKKKASDQKNNEDAPGNQKVSDPNISYPYPLQQGPISGAPLPDDRRTWAKSRIEAEKWALLQGDWISSCLYEGTKKYVERYTIKDNLILKYKVFYPGLSNCIQGEIEGSAYIFEVERNYKYEQPDFFNIEVSPISIKRFVFDSTLTQSNNESHFCGISSWESTKWSNLKGVELLGTRCSEGFSSRQPSRLSTILRSDLLSVQVDGRNSPPLRRDQNAQIVGGSKISLQTSVLAKSTVGIVIADSRGTSTCSGTLIGKSYVVTAAHCFAEVMPKEVTNEVIQKTNVIFGESTKTGRKVSVSKILIHPDFKPKEMTRFPDFPKAARNDIALLTLSETAPEPYSPVAILPLEVGLQNGEKIRVAGFGEDEESHHGDLKSTEVTLYSFDKISQMIIAKTNTGQSTHVGDSGGPLFVERSGWLYLVGATSYGTNYLHVINGDGFYIDLRYYRDWLTQNAH
jgi:V8-like Glu-specific endopeptidase